MKNRRIKVLTTACILAVLLTILSGCDYNRTAEQNSTKEETIEEKSEVKTEEKIIYQIKTEQIQYEYIDESEKEKWREPLIMLLENMKSPKFEKMICDIPYPGRPAIEHGYSASLMDINLDGVPELFIDVGGGSAQNRFYYVYDLLTGKELGTLNGGYNDTWCVYFNRQSGSYEVLSHFEWRIGWMGKSRFVSSCEITTDPETCEDILVEHYLMSAHYSISTNDPDDFEDKLAFDSISFYVDGTLSYIDEYFEAQDEFNKNYVRLFETSMVTVHIEDLPKDDKSKEEITADNLLNTSQIFIRPLYNIKQKN